QPIKPIDPQINRFWCRGTRRLLEAIEALLAAAIDLPAFSTLDRLVNRVRAEVHRRIFDRVAVRLTSEHVSALETLLTKPPNSPTTSFNRLKQAPGPATPKTIDLWINRLDWLAGVLDPDPLLEGIAHTKLRQFAAEATALEVNDLLDISQPGKRHTLILALLRQARMRGRDELIEMMLLRIRRTQALAKEQLESLHDEQRGIEEALIGIFGKVLETAQNQETDAAFGCQVRKLLTEQGGVDALAEQCETVSALHRDDELPLLWPIHARHRSLLFRLLDLMDIQSATQDCSLLDHWRSCANIVMHAAMNWQRLSMSASLPTDGKVSSANAGPNLAPSSDAPLYGASSVKGLCGSPSVRLRRFPSSSGFGLISVLLLGTPQRPRLAPRDARARGRTAPRGSAATNSFVDRCEAVATRAIRVLVLTSRHFASSLRLTFNPRGTRRSAQTRLRRNLVFGWIFCWPGP